MMADGQHLLWGADSGELYIWDIQRFKMCQVVQAHDTTISQLALLNNGVLITASQDQSLKVWEIT